MAQETLENTTVTLPSYTEEEQQRIADGTMTVPEQAQFRDRSNRHHGRLSVHARSHAGQPRYALCGHAGRCTTESGKETLATVDQLGENEGFGTFRFYALNNSDEGHEKELKNGGMGMDVLQAEETTAYFLLHNNGGHFAEGDPILFQGRANETNLDLFEVPISHIMDTEITIDLDASVYDGKGYCYNSMTVTPISLVINGSYTLSSDQSTPNVTVALMDGTSFDLASISNKFQHSRLRKLR